jgi:hypothetical protein
VQPERHPPPPPPRSLGPCTTRSSATSAPRRAVNYWGYDSDAGRFRVIFFSNDGPYTEDGTISAAWWLRDENGEWQPWMDNRFSKVEG